MIPMNDTINGVKYWNIVLSNINPLAEIGEDSIIHSPVWIADGVKIGKRVKIQAFVFIPKGVVIEDDVFIGPHVCFTNDPKMDINNPNYLATTFVRKGAKIGANSSILAGVIIGENATIGMGSVVLKDVPAWKTWCGNPAKRIDKKS